MHRKIRLSLPQFTSQFLLRKWNCPSFGILFSQNSIDAEKKTQRSETCSPFIHDFAFFNSSPPENYMLSFILKHSCSNLELKHSLHFQKAQTPNTEKTSVKMLWFFPSLVAAVFPRGSQTLENLVLPS